jgi:phage/conjugal plasmid C-4 type zinc finger TraR family protein
MSDDVDRASLVEEQARQNATQAIILPLRGRGSEFCVDCGDPILGERRMALQSAERCLDCQIDFEGVGR